MDGSPLPCSPTDGGQASTLPARCPQPGFLPGASRHGPLPHCQGLALAPPVLALCTPAGARPSLKRLSLLSVAPATRRGRSPGRAARDFTSAARIVLTLLERENAAREARRGKKCGEGGLLSGDPRGAAGGRPRAGGYAFSLSPERGQEFRGTLALAPRCEPPRATLNHVPIIRVDEPSTACLGKRDVN
eukprot:gene5784-biopygen8806